MGMFYNQSCHSKYQTHISGRFYIGVAPPPPPPPPGYRLCTYDLTLGRYGGRGFGVNHSLCVNE